LLESQALWACCMLDLCRWQRVGCLWVGFGIGLGEPEKAALWKLSSENSTAALPVAGSQGITTFPGRGTKSLA
jgi:hypothetical protein